MQKEGHLSDQSSRGVGNFEQITIRDSKFAAQRFAHEAAPALTSFANSSPAPFAAGIKAARQRIVARTDQDRESFLRKNGLSTSETMTHVLDLQVPSLIKPINSRIASSTYRLADETTLAKLVGCGSNLSAGSLRIRSMRSF